MRRTVLVLAVVVLVCSAGGALQAQVISVHTSPAAGDVGVQIHSTTSLGWLNGYRILYTDEAGTNGLDLIGLQSGGMNVGESSGIAFAPVFASAFNVASDLRAKKDLELIEPGESSTYLEHLRNIETIAFRYLSEDEGSTPFKHIGVAAQSLPGELIALTTERPDGTGDEYLAARLADWVGLLTVCLKEADRRIADLEAEMASLKEKPAPARQ